MEFVCILPPVLSVVLPGARLLTSLTLVADELGVPCADPTGERLSLPAAALGWDGEALPEAESFFLEDLLESLALDNCSN